MQCRVCGKAKLKAGQQFKMHVWWHGQRERLAEARRTKNLDEAATIGAKNDTDIAHEKTLTALEVRRDRLNCELETVNSALVAVAFLINEGKGSK